MYAIVKNGTVEKVVNKLPSSFENISGFDKADLATIISKGFYPVDKLAEPVLSLDQIYGNQSYIIQDDKVVITRELVTRTLDELKLDLKNKGRSFAMNKFEEEYPYSQGLAIALNVFGTAARDNMITRLNELVGAYKTFSDEVDSCTTKAELLVVYNNYPQLRD